MVVILVLAAILFSLLFPETPTGCFAKRHFVDAPAQWLNSLSPLKIFALIAVAIVIAICSAAFPAELALIAAGDLTAYIEIAAALAVLTSKLRFRQFTSHIVIVIRRISIQIRRFGVAIRLRARRLRPVQQSESDSIDEDATPVLA